MQHYGDFYTYRFLNPWTRPMQQPHPPCYIVGTGSPETIELAAELGFGYSAVFVTKKRAKELDTSASAPPSTATTRRRISFRSVVMTYVAETQEKAEQEFRPHLHVLLRGRFAHDPAISGPPATSRSQFRKRPGSPTVHGTSTWTT